MQIEDVVYGTIDIPHEISLILDTPQFRRLLKIAQLGLLPKVWPNANYSRYDHCIGVYWAARKMLNHLEENTSWLGNNKIPPLYRNAVELAALLHDVGHGAFSHTWEGINYNFHHEANAEPCIDAIFATVDAQYFPELRENNNYGIELIKALILGEPARLPEPVPSKYRFIFEIVNNKQCKVDVDKWDYLNRDKHYLKNLCAPNTDFGDVFLCARVTHDGSHIEYRYKDFHKIYAIFEARMNLHVKCYRSAQVLAVDKILKMIIQGCDETLADKYLAHITAQDMDAFLQLTDEKVLELIKSEELFEYIEHPEIIKFDEGAFLPQINPKTCCIFYDKILGPGVEMPPDDSFYLYGDASEKQPIVRNNNSTEIEGYFALRRKHVEYHRWSDGYDT